MATPCFATPTTRGLRDLSGEDPQERDGSAERGLTYVKLDGDVGILANGAGLSMSTLDVVAEAGGTPANFLDAGGGSRADAITSAVEVILSDPKVKAVLFNIFGGITRCDEVAKGLIEAFKLRSSPTVPFVVRLDGTNGEEGRASSCQDAASAQCPRRVHDGRSGGQGRRVGEPTHRRADEHPRWGHRRGCARRASPGARAPSTTLRNRDYGTNVVGGVAPGKGGQDVEGVPVFNTFHDAVEARWAPTRR